jgi:hypothetical protein
MEGPVTLLAGNILLEFAVVPSAFDQQPTNPLKDHLVRTWDLVSNYAVRQDGTRLDPFGPNPGGRYRLRPSIPRGCRTWPVSIALVSMLYFLSPAIAQVSQPELPPNTLRCEGFKKTSDGTWYAEKSAPFDIGDTNEVTVERQVIGPGSHKIGGIDLYVLLERKCGGSRG